MNNSTDSPDERDPEQAPQEQPSRQYAAGRFPKWIALAVLSLLAWLATIGGVHRHQMDRSEKWALTATTLSVVFAALGVLCYVFARGMFMGQPTEVALVSSRIWVIAFVAAFDLLYVIITLACFSDTILYSHSSFLRRLSSLSFGLGVFP